jgi:ABC-type Fe3+/spermidine/putrescine transport system ATPase subunit
MDTQSHGSDPLNITGLDLIALSGSYGKQKVVSDFSLSFTLGELFCLLGPSGCGKTTILKIVTGLLEPDGGRVILEGQDITHLPPQKRNVSLVFQNYALFPNLNVFENVAYGLRQRRVSGDELQRRVEETLALVHLAEYTNRRVHEISGGEQQRIALARALVVRPRLLLLDEPLSNLDARLRADIRKEIRSLQRELGLTMVYVTHDQEEALSLSDRIGVMNAGRLEQTGSPRDIYEHPATRFVADFIGHCNFIEGEIKDGNLSLLGKHFAVPAPGIPAGEKVICAIRPERVQLKTSTDVDWKGRIREAEYTGPTVRYQIVLEGGSQSVELIAEVPVSQAIFRIGESVGLEIKPEDFRLFARQP